MPIHFGVIDSRNRNDFHIPTTLILLKSLFSRWRTEWNADWTSWRKILKRQRWPSNKNGKKMFRCSISSSRQTSPRGFGWVSHQFCTHGKAAHPLFSAFMAQWLCIVDLSKLVPTVDSKDVIKTENVRSKPMKAIRKVSFIVSNPSRFGLIRLCGCVRRRLFGRFDQCCDQKSWPSNFPFHNLHLSFRPLSSVNN